MSAKLHKKSKCCDKFRGKKRNFVNFKEKDESIENSYTMKIYTTQELRSIDNYTIEHDGISSMDLIERVAEAVADEITSRWRSSKPVMVFAGSGNNGADGLAVSRLLAEQGYQVKVYLFNIGGNKLTEECAACRDKLVNQPGVDLQEVVDTFMLPDLQRNLLIVDALFGTGLKAPLSGGYSYLVQRINEAHATVVSIDVPSGLSGDWNPKLISRDVIHANLTLAVQYPRFSFFIEDNAELVGEWKLLDIGLSEEAASNIAVKYYLVEESDVRRALKQRNMYSSKQDYGDAIIYAGSYGMMGAAVLAAKGALRAGVGKLTVESPKCGYTVLQTAVPEALYSHNRGDGVIENIQPMHEYKAVAIGPGIGTMDKTIDALARFLDPREKPVILDADALNCIAKRPNLLTYIPVLSILTPHAGEFDRLFGEHLSAEARLRKAVEVAQHYKIIIVMKGRYTAIVRPDGKIYFNSSGCPAMATAGSGDVLTGMIAAMIAQGYKPEIATLVSVFIHGYAGELASMDHGDYGVTAMDIANNVGRAIRLTMEGNVNKN